MQLTSVRRRLYELLELHRLEARFDSVGKAVERLHRRFEMAEGRFRCHIGVASLEGLQDCSVTFIGFAQQSWSPERYTDIHDRGVLQ